MIEIEDLVDFDRNQDLVWLIRLVDSSPSLPSPSFLSFWDILFFQERKGGGGDFARKKET